MLLQPSIDEEDQQYFDAWEYLYDDRPYLSHGAGMSGSLLLKQKTPRAMVRLEGIRLGFDGDELEDFVIIIMSLENLDLAESMRQQFTDLLAAIKAAGKK